MTNYLKTNIRWLRKQKGLTQSELADKIGVNRAMVGSYEEDRAAPKVPVLQTLSLFFNVSIDDLFNKDLSKESQHGKKKKDKDIRGHSLRVLSTIVDRDDKELVTVVPAKAAAGYLNGYADPEYIESLPKFELPLPEMSKERTYRAFQIKGDSMSPVPSGAYIIGEYIQNWQEIKDGRTYIVVTHEEGIVYKRTYNRIEEDEELLLKSDNPEYEPFSIPVSDIIDVWKAVGFISFELPEPEDMSLHKLSSEIEKLKNEIQQIKDETSHDQ